MICSLIDFSRKKYYLGGILLVFILDYYGFFAHLFEKEFTKGFQYPYNGDITSFVAKLQNGLTPEMKPINIYDYPYIHIQSTVCKSVEDLRLVYIIKSSAPNFDRRETIRRTWGFERRFSDVKIRTFFILGENNDPVTQVLINQENNNFGDIIQFQFLDTYYNSTIKTMCAFNWITKYCSNSKFYFFSDDDMYVSTKNVLRFLRNPVNYPDYLQLPSYLMEEVETNSEKSKADVSKFYYKNSLNYELPKNVVFFSGFVFVSSPHRHKSSKWYVSLKEYPYNMWPPYVTAGAYVLSREALFKLYYASMYTRHFKFDDIYLGLVALKAGIEPFHCDQFHFYKKEYNAYNYKFVIASHGYENPEELENVWAQQKEAGNA